MPRIRTIKPEFHSDEKVMSVSRSARLLFVGMFNFADDRGAMVNSHKELKARVFPGDGDTDVPGWLAELMGVGLVIAYEADGKSYLQIKNFAKHQVIDKARKSSLPLPPETEINGNQLKSTEINGNQLKSRENCSGREGKGKERKGKKEREKSKKPAAAKSAAGSLDFRWSDFEELRKGWPRQDGEAEARKVWGSLARQKLLPTLAVLTAAVEKQKRSQQWADPVFVPKLARWLRERRWGDELPEGKAGGQGRPLHGEAHCPHDLQRRECAICRDYVPDGKGGWRMPGRGGGQATKGP